jgi:hypothetical protein
VKAPLDAVHDPDRPDEPFGGAESDREFVHIDGFWQEVVDPAANSIE